MITSLPREQSHCGAIKSSMRTERMDTEVRLKWYSMSQYGRKVICFSRNGTVSRRTNAVIGHEGSEFFVDVVESCAICAAATQ
jgi:hypothetical protein